MYAICENGHQIELPSNYCPPDGVIAQIGWCELEVARPDLGGIIIPCRARIYWKREIIHIPDEIGAFV